MSKKGRRSDYHPGPGPALMNSIPRRLADGLDQATELMSDQRWLEAQELLLSLDRQYPNHPDVVGMLVNLNFELKDMFGYQAACERLVRLLPNDRDAAISLAAAYLNNALPMLALRQFRQFLTRFPDDEYAADARASVAELEVHTNEILTNLGVSLGDIDLVVQHEEVQSLLNQTRYPEARKTAERLLARWPAFVPALNNLSLVHYSEDNIEQAIATAQRALAISPDNVHALSNLVHYDLVNGRIEDAQQMGERLKSVPADNVDTWFKQAEAFGFLGDDQAIVDLFVRAQRAHALDTPASAMLYHLAAVAELRLGREHHARQYWKNALALSPGLLVAQENLENAKAPIGERFAPWPFDMRYWMTHRTAQDIITEMQTALQRDDTEAMARSARRMSRRHPHLIKLLPIWLDHGDRVMQGLAIQIALVDGSPETLAALRDYALGQRGQDTMRNMAANAAAEAGLLPSSHVRLWMEGEWREVLLMGFEVTDEPTSTYEHAERVQDLLSSSIEVMRDGEIERAEQLLKQALELEPGAPDLLHNLATAYRAQGREDEAEAILQQVHERFPDYLFAQASLARIYAARGDTVRARELVDPMLTRKRLHFSEYALLCATEIEIDLARGELKNARSWLDMLEETLPGHPAIEELQQRIKEAKKPRR